MILYTGSLNSVGAHTKVRPDPANSRLWCGRNPTWMRTSDLRAHRNYQHDAPRAAHTVRRSART